jgi:hypothetical protein
MVIEDGVNLDACLHAVGGMGWIFADSHEREKTIHMVWEARIISGDERHRERSHQREYSEDQRAQVAPRTRPRTLTSQPKSRPGTHAPLAPVCLNRRPVSTSPSPTVASRARNNALTGDGSCSWPTYAPPTTLGSMMSNVTTNRSASPPASGVPRTLSSTSTRYSRTLTPS